MSFNQAAWDAIMTIVNRGETAEVRMTSDGLKIYESKKKLIFGKSNRQQKDQKPMK